MTLRRIRVEATYRSETARLAEATTDLLAAEPADRALRSWMDLFVDYLATKRGLGDALRTILTDDGDRMRTRYLLADALGVLLAAGARQGTIRADLDAYDVLLGLGGITLITGEPDQRALTGRLLDLLMAGLSAGAGRPAQVV